MVKKYDITGFDRTDEKSHRLITKFGGQPVWVNETEWPLSAGWDDRKMMFVGQIAVEKNMLGNKKAFAAYIFMTHPESVGDPFFDPDISELDGGENVVIIQTVEDDFIGSTANSRGPTLFDENDESYEYIPVLKEGYDPDFITNEEFRNLDSRRQDEYFDAVDTNKIGGTPNFFREDAWPDGDWILLLQLKCSFLPFVLRAGDMPVMYVFVSKDFKKAGMLIQD